MKSARPGMGHCGPSRGRSPWRKIRTGAGSLAAGKCSRKLSMSSSVASWNARCEPRSACAPPKASTCPDATKSRSGTTFVLTTRAPGQPPCRSAGTSSSVTATWPALGTATGTLPASSRSSWPACCRSTPKCSVAASATPLPRRGIARERHWTPGAAVSKSRGSWRSTPHWDRFWFFPTREPMRRLLLTTFTPDQFSAVGAAPLFLLRRPLAPELSAWCCSLTMKATYGTDPGGSGSALHAEANPTGGSVSSGTSMQGASSRQRNSTSRGGRSPKYLCSSAASPCLGHRLQEDGIGVAPMRSTHAVTDSACLRPAMWIPCAPSS
mmetsp:Transcript_47829/g.138290  ORF Transcript_47829/g.138290 Transcript_47829/m.138290 type:complete len:324 (-) Transcript_47829:1172-2143(-)